MRRILCLFGLHERDAERVYHDGHGWTAPCRGCDRPMVKSRRGDRLWMLAEKATLETRGRTRI